MARGMRIAFGGGADLSAYMYGDAGNPAFTTKHGYGNLANNRADLRPAQKKILIDGTTSTNGNYYHVASLAAAIAAHSGGDWLLFPGGQTSTSAWTLNSLLSGTNSANPTVIGTFDPADKENDSKFNTLRHTLDTTGIGSGNSSVIFYLSNKSNFAFVNFNFISGTSDGETDFNIYGINAGYILFENCTFDGVKLTVQNYGINRSCTITSSGTTATVTLATANSLLQTGDTVSIEGANESAFNIAATVNVTNSTTFTYTFAGNSNNPATGSILYNPPVIRVADSQMITDITLRYCGFMYASSGLSSGNAGNMHIDGYRRFRVEACIDFHGGWGRGITRATAATSGGPSDRKHGLYLDDFGDDVKIMDSIIGAWDSSNAKFTGGNYWVQNMVTIRAPMAWLFAATTSNYGNTSWPSGTLFKSENHLQVSTDDLNTTDAAYRGWGPWMTFTNSGSYYNGGLLLNNDAATSTNKAGIAWVSTYAPHITTVGLISNCVLGNWNYQDTSTAPDAYTTLTFTNNVWDSATSGSNTKISDMPGAYQTRLTNTLALNVHTTLRNALPDWFGGVSVGGTDMLTEVAMFEFMCNNPIPGAVHSDSSVTSWATLFQYHWRSKLAGVT